MFRNHKALKIILLVILGLLLIVGSVGLYLSNNVERIVKERVAEATGGAVSLDIGNVHVSLIGKTVRLGNVSVLTDQQKLEQWNRRRGKNLDPMAISIDDVEIGGIRLRKKHRGASWITLNRPRVALDISDREKEDESVDSTSDNNMSDMIRELGIDRIRINNGELVIRTAGDNGDVGWKAHDINMDVRGFDMDSVSIERDRILYSDRITLSVGGISQQAIGGNSALEIGQIELDTDGNFLTVEQIRLIPKYAKNEFAQKTGGRSDWTRVDVGRVECAGIDFNALMDNGEIRMEKMTVSELDVATYKNRKVSLNNIVKPMYHQMLQRAPFKIDIAVLECIGAKVVYDELAVDGITPGTIIFNSLNGTFTDFTNIVSSPGQRIKLTASGRLMGEGEIRANFTFPVDSLHNWFDATGYLRNQSIPPLNKMITPLAYVEANSGSIHRLDFYIMATDHTSSTDMTLLYNDLKITILKHDGNQVTERKVLSALANGLLIKDSNPDVAGTRHTSSTAQRDIYRSPFNYLWRSLFAGIKKTIGIPDKDVKETVSGPHHPRGIFQLGDREEDDREALITPVSNQRHGIFKRSDDPEHQQRRADRKAARRQEANTERPRGIFGRDREEE